MTVQIRRLWVSVMQTATQGLPVMNFAPDSAPGEARKPLSPFLRAILEGRAPVIHPFDDSLKLPQAHGAQEARAPY